MLRRGRLVVLVVLALSGFSTLVLGSGQAALRAGDCVPEASWGTNQATLASEVLTLVNQHRASLGLTQLQTSASLTRAAEWKSLHMAGVGYFAHDDQAPPVARSVGERLAACGYPTNGGGARTSRTGMRQLRRS